MRSLYALLAAVAVSACTSAIDHLSGPGPVTAPVNTVCHARAGAAMEWRVDREDVVELARWCRAVGPPVIATRIGTEQAAPALDELVILSWNAHLAEGELEDLIARLKSGAFTNGRPAERFVLLVQELYRRGDDVPAFDPRDRSAFAIRPRDPDAADAADYAARLGLSLIYVPSMRNGSELREDRGNAIISTEPLLDPVALELPLSRQRRVALAAAIAVEGGRIEVINTHLEPLSSPKTLWVFQDPRAAQVRAILDLLSTPRYRDAAGVIWGGDFNTVRGGDTERAYRDARAWSSSLALEDRRSTHMMGRLDYLFFRLSPEWAAATRRLDDRFGSDHYPVLGTFTRISS